ncbi:MAG: glycosyltransferase family A protein [Candidatus Kapabacteria bacterium]|nr:glycosyltransferase family A protein [Candidatus Kapabacteria bacterium]
MTLAPIVLFVYNRPKHTQRVLDSLAANAEAKDSELFIYCDGPKEGANADTLKRIDDVRTLVKLENRFKKVQIIEQTKNKGLANSIIDGVTEVVNNYGTVIVLEDDLETSKYFLQYMNDGLIKYQNKDKVISIHAYCYPLKRMPKENYFIKGADCWGWATWKRGWDLFNSDSKELLDTLIKQKAINEFNFDNKHNYLQMLKDQINGKNDSWAIRWYASAFLNNKLTLHPKISLVRNIGFGSESTHNKVLNSFFDINISSNPVYIDDKEIIESKPMRKEIEKFYRFMNLKILINTIRNYLKTKIIR